jgi:hypothetical protein
MVHNKDSGSLPITAKTLYSLFKAALVILAGLIPCAFFWEIYNLIRFKGREFTEDGNLIKYTQAIAPKFTNRDSIRYRKGNDHWETVAMCCG